VERSHLASAEINNCNASKDQVSTSAKITINEGTTYRQQNLKLQHLQEECISKGKNFSEKTSTTPARKPYQ
jgi:hypothetical protein